MGFPAEELEVCWLLLHSSVRLERRWSRSVRAAAEEALRTALTLGPEVTGCDAPALSLAELRVQLLARIRGLLHPVATPGGPAAAAGTRSAAQRAADEMLEVLALLERGIDLRTCACTERRDARRRLLRRLSPGSTDEALLDDAVGLVKRVCVELQRRGARWRAAPAELAHGPTRRSRAH